MSRWKREPSSTAGPLRGVRAGKEEGGKRRKNDWKRLDEDPANTFGQTSLVEVEQQADAQSEEPKVRGDLGPVNRKYVFHAFELDQDGAIDDDISAIRVLDHDAFVLEAYAYLLFNRHACQLELVRQAPSVGVFKQTGTESAMHLDRSGKHAMRQIGMKEVGVSTMH
jgi:hypothetical protein